ncbi:MAG: tRNA dihydrouridine synthase [Bacteriovoracaceae bacterium]
MSLAPVPFGSLFFAPMEGITEESFRKIILKLYPEWDYLATDFLRVPSAGRYPVKHLLQHIGLSHYEVPWVMEKTMYQILTSHTAFTTQMVNDLQDLGIPWIDINLGCPSTQVCKNKGGSFLLQDIPRLQGLIRDIRKTYRGRFTAKMRIGYSDTSPLLDVVKMLNDEGVEMITVHGRTKDMMYKEPARWEFIAQAVKVSQVPIIGNGDIWDTKDIDRMLKETGCHGVMVARGALKLPWMAQDYRRGFFESTDEKRIARMKEFFREYREELEKNGISVRGLLKQSKSVSRNLLDGIQNGEVMRRKLLLAQTVPEFYDHLESL